MRYVIIGNSAAAVGAVESIRKYDTRNPILMISDEPYHTYSRPLISYYLAGSKEEAGMLYRPKNFYQVNGVETLFGTKALTVDTARKEVYLDNGEKVSFDRLLVATGGKPFIPPIEGAAGEKIYSFIKLDDAKKLKEIAQPGKKAVVVGGGLIGLKVAEGLLKRGVKVSVVDLAPQVLSSILDSAGAQVVQKHLEKQGMQFHLGTTAKTIQSFGPRKIVGLASGMELTADFMVLAVGVVSNIEIVEGTDIKVNRGIITDDHMRTSVADIYAAGDVAENYDVLLQQQRVIPILPNAYEQGQVAGANMAGREAVYPGGFAKNAVSFFGLSLVTAGLVKATEDSEEYVAQPGENQYLKIVIRDGRLVGFIRINAVDRAGILTGLMVQQLDVSQLISRLLTPELGLIDLPDNIRRSRLQGGAVQWR